MTKYFWIIQVIQILLEWYEKSSADKKITDDEIAEVITKVAKITRFSISV